MKKLWIETTEHKPWQEKQLEATQSTDEKIQTLRITDNQGQTMDGFGGCFNELGWIALQKVDEKVRQTVIKELFDQDTGCRFNFCRLPMGASDYAAQWYSHNEHDDDYAMEQFSISRDYDYLIPYIQQAKKHVDHLKLFASPWSPPTWMKEPKAYNHGRLIMDDKVLKAYALYFLKFVKAYAEEGLTIGQIHVQNEPFADQKFPSCIWSGEQMRRFIGEYLGPLFAKEGMDTEIWLGTLNGPEQMSFGPGQIIIHLFDNYVDHVMFDEKAKKYIKGIGYQWAGREAIQRTRDSYPDIKLMQTENECGDGQNSWVYARYVFNLMRHYLRNGVNSYTYWNMVLEPGGSSTWGWRQNTLITINPETAQVIYNPEFYVMKHFSRFVDRGAVRLDVEGPWSGAAVAFKNPDGSHVVIVANHVQYSRKLAIKHKEDVYTVVLAPHSFHTFVM